MSTRRQFLTAAAAGAVLRPLRAETPDSRVEVLVNEPIGTIAPEIYSHFAENLGAVIYDGIWVGERSAVPHVGGIRKQLIDALRKINPAVIRWPGGCFADQYDWRDGIGPREKRPTRTSFWLGSPEWPPNARRDGPGRYDPNDFGTIEFARFCRLAGAQPYFAANLRSLPAQDFWRWVEYCNSPAGATTLAQQRAADGEKEPLNVRYWGVGNESWGCGGNFSPDDYATEFRRYTAWVPGYALPLRLVGSGPNGGDTEWTRRFFRKMAEGDALPRMWGWALHDYSWNVTGGRSTDWSSSKGDGLKFTPEEFYEIVREAEVMDALIRTHWNVMAETDRQHSVKLVVDEWGAWYAPGTEPFPEALLGQQSTMRDAVLASSTLDTFHRHADKVAMANIAQLVNCLQALFLAHEDRFSVTPTYHVFAMYAAHQGAQSLRTVISAPAVPYTRNTRPAALAGLSGSASLRGSRMTLTVTNPSLDQAREAEIVLRGARLKNARAVTLAPSDPHAHNTFENPRAVEPREEAPAAPRTPFVRRFPPASVTKLEIELG
jgi:alpha-N-arabinofuranosidase